MLGFWRRRSSTGTGTAQRWVVVDVETSGMDASCDELISIAGVALRGGRVHPADSIELFIKPSKVSPRDNILVHGIGEQAQLAGTDARDAIRSFIDFVGPAPLIAFHAQLDRGFLVRATKLHSDRPLDNAWLDLAELAPVLDPEARLKSLDEWLQRYRIPVIARHTAAGDAFATALLAARLLFKARRQGASDLSALRRLAGSARWIG